MSRESLNSLPQYRDPEKIKVLSEAESHEVSKLGETLDGLWKILSQLNPIKKESDREYYQVVLEQANALATEINRITRTENNQGNRMRLEYNDVTPELRLTFLTILEALRQYAGTERRSAVQGDSQRLVDIQKSVKDLEKVLDVTQEILDEKSETARLYEEPSLRESSRDKASGVDPKPPEPTTKIGQFYRGALQAKDIKHIERGE